MSKTLLIMRHAKSDWSDSTLSDFDRPLNKRGSRDAPRMGKRLHSEGYRCDLLLASPALRAKTTAEAVAECIGYPLADIVWDASLYMADIEDYMRVIAKVNPAVEHLMIVSHNPGSEMLIQHLCGERFEKFPTAAYALLEVEGTWERMDRVQFIDFDFPKSMAD